MVCDIVIADETAKFGTPEATVGLIPGPGVARGAAHVNLHWLKLMVLAGEILDAREAQLAGLVNRVTPAGEHLAAAEALAAKIADKAPLALAVGKQVLNAALRGGLPARDRRRRLPAVHRRLRRRHRRIQRTAPATIQGAVTESVNRNDRDHGSLRGARATAPSGP